MKHRGLIAAAMVVVVTSACGGGATPPSEVKSEERAPDAAAITTTSAPATLSEDELRPKLLTLADLPKGYVASPEEEEEADGSDEPDFCDAAFKPFEELGVTDSGEEGPLVAANFEKGETNAAGGAFLTQNLGSADANEIAAAFDGLPGAFEQCREFTDTDADGTLKASLASIPFAQLGDETFAVHISGTMSTPERANYPVSGDMVLVRKASIVMFVIAFGFGDVTIPGAELEQIVRAAYAKL